MNIHDTSNFLEDEKRYHNEEHSGRSVNVDDVMFTLYTQNSNKSGQVIEPTMESIQQSDYDPRKITKMITHGFQSSGKSDTCQTIKNEYLKTYDYNVIVMDWSNISSDPTYFIPVFNTRSVGHYYGFFVDLLIGNGANPKEIHLIGHSLGAHISGFAANSLTKGKIGRITGLDPAYPSFGIIQLAGGRLSTSDANFVDIIHSCGGVLGLYEPIGHVDFYPNGGTMPQPGCSYFEMIDACSHGRSWQYFRESINADIKFTSYKCISFDEYKHHNCSNRETEMGEHVSHSARGLYYLKTNTKPMFALGNQLKKQRT